MRILNLRGPDKKFTANYLLIGIVPAYAPMLEIIIRHCLFWKRSAVGLVGSGLPDC